MIRHSTISIRLKTWNVSFIDHNGQEQNKEIFAVNKEGARAKFDKFMEKNNLTGTNVLVNEQVPQETL